MSITLQFHPDWPTRDGADDTVIEAMARDAVYLSQFVTGTSNGGLTAFRGGARWRWESRLFGGRYDEAPASTRPVYAAWNRRGDPYGGAIRFGSSYSRLRPEASERTTFCFPDSAMEPAHFGGPDVLQALCRLADEANADALDDYVEAQVHGPVRLSEDVECFVLDPCFRDSLVEDVARGLGCAVEFHAGFRASPDTFDHEYRGTTVTALARLLGPVLTPNVIGAAARSRRHDPKTIKQVWHCLARFGRQPRR